MQEIRAQDLQARRIVYHTERAGDQMSWYRSKVQANQRGAFLWFGVGIVAQVLALAAAAARLVLPPSLNLIGLFSPIAAAAMAWTQLRRHDELTRGYALAADELLTLQELIQRAKDEDEFAKLVDESEGAISREHKMWVAKRA